MKKDFNVLKEAEKNVVKIARFWQDMLKICDALNIVGNNACREHVARDDFFKGLNILRNAMYRELVHSMSDCFVFSGVGGKEINDFSREQFEKLFHNDPKECKFVIMNFLEQFGQRPSSWYSDEEEKFRKQATEKINEFKKEKEKSNG
jgi:hypothetical protein